MVPKTVKYKQEHIRILSQRVLGYLSAIGFFIWGENMSTKKSFNQKLDDMMKNNPGSGDYMNFYSKKGDCDNCPHGKTLEQIQEEVKKLQEAQ